MSLLWDFIAYQSFGLLDFTTSSLTGPQMTFGALNRRALTTGAKRIVGTAVVLTAMLVFGQYSDELWVDTAPSSTLASGSEPPRGLSLARFEYEAATTEARRVANWVADSGDNAGAANGDDSTPGIGTRPIALVRTDEGRLERLAKRSIDNRISFGSINVPVRFYEAHIGPIFAMHEVVIYALPEDKPVEQVFGTYVLN
jgi:hypothetical protein